MFHLRIKELRTKKGLTQAELAKEFNLGRTAVSMWEKKKSYPNLRMLNDLADFFDVSVDYLVGNQTVSLTPEVNSLIKRIKELMCEKKFTVKDLADIAALEEDTLNDFLNEDINSQFKDVDCLYAIAHALGTTVEYLTTGNEEYKAIKNKDELKASYFNLALDIQKTGIPPEDIKGVLEILKKHKF